MYDFNSITLESKELIKEYLNINKYENSEYNFITWFAWKESLGLQYTIICDCLCVLGNNKYIGWFAYFPVGTKDNVKLAISKLIDYFGKEGKPFIFISLSDVMMSILEEYSMLDLFKVENRRDFADYIYRRDKLVSLSGNKLHGKRNHFNYFHSSYEYELVPVTKDIEEECMLKVTELIENRSENKYDELTATLRILKNRDELALCAEALYVNGRIEGVIIGEDHNGVSLIHIAKANIEYRGISTALFKLFLEKNFTNCTYVNFMEDIGLEGLRKMKLSYRPEYLLQKNTLRLK